MSFRWLRRFVRPRIGECQNGMNERTSAPRWASAAAASVVTAPTDRVENHPDAHPVRRALGQRVDDGVAGRVVTENEHRQIDASASPTR